jgi:hypothetical protein
MTPADGEIAHLRKVLEFPLGKTAHHIGEGLLLIEQNSLRQISQPVLVLLFLGLLDLAPVRVGIDVGQELRSNLVPCHIAEVHWRVAKDWVLHLLNAKS